MPKKTSKRLFSKNDPHMLAIAGMNLNAAKAQLLEGKLKRNPSDVSCRIKLLAYYFRYSYSDKNAAKRRIPNLLWMIKYHPENKILSSPIGWIEKTEYPAIHNKCKTLWLRQVTDHKNDVAVITNAASFVGNDIRLSEKLYKTAITLDPDNPDWSRNLAWKLRVGARKNSLRMKRALANLEAALKKTKKASYKRYLYDNLAETAFDIGDWQLAHKYAQKSVSQANKFGKDWYNGNAVHDGNCVLGRLALREKNIKKARLYLQAASQTEGSPQLNSFGPNMRFAQEMLQAGEREAVISYLESCKRFWEGRSTKLSEVIAQIQSGKSVKLPRVI